MLTWQHMFKVSKITPTFFLQHNLSARSIVVFSCVFLNGSIKAKCLVAKTECHCLRWHGVLTNQEFYITKTGFCQPGAGSDCGRREDQMFMTRAAQEVGIPVERDDMTHSDTFTIT